jgi:pentose-5-phosphate-3-epimerase
MMISLSILEYEPDLSEHLDDLTKSESLFKIISLIETGRIHRVHIDVMRPPLISRRARFSVELILRLYEALNKRVLLATHLMVDDPFPIIETMNEFIPRGKRAEISIVVQRESFGSEKETIEALNFLRGYSFKVGICLDLPTLSENLTRKIIEHADTVLLMSVPMGRGGQKYSEKATQRIAYFSQKFPDKAIEVDGGITPQTIVTAKRAGAKIGVVGSFITQNENPSKAVLELEERLESVQG